MAIYETKWIERKRRGEAIREFLKSPVYTEIIGPAIEKTKNDGHRSAYQLCGDTSPHKAITALAFASAYQTMQDWLFLMDKDADIDLENPPKEEEGPDITQ